jgi:hypothetical protein
MGRPAGGGLSTARRRALWVLSWLDVLLVFLIGSAATAGDLQVVMVLLPTHALALGLLMASFAWWARYSGSGWRPVLAVALAGPLGALRALAWMTDRPRGS